MITFKEDISTKIKSDFKESAEEALNLLTIAISKTEELHTDRIIRCIVFLAHGNTMELKKYIALAAADPRDIISAAEYDYSENLSKTTRIRDFNQAFDDCIF